jgi:hypothetical protein
MVTLSSNPIFTGPVKEKRDTPLLLHISDYCDPPDTCRQKLKTQIGDNEVMSFRAAEFSVLQAAPQTNALFIAILPRLL